MVAKMTAAEREQFKEGTRARLPPGADGRIAVTGRANAIKGRVPK
jgi:hypothetical protein